MLTPSFLCIPHQPTQPVLVLPLNTYTCHISLSCSWILVTQSLSKLILTFSFLLLSSPTWRVWNGSYTARCVMRWWSSPSSCRASTVCVCCVRLTYWYKEAILPQTSLLSPTRQPQRPTHGPHDRHADQCPEHLTAWTESSEQVMEMVCVSERVLGECYFILALNNWMMSASKWSMSYITT